MQSASVVKGTISTTNILHDADSLLGLSHKLILGLFNFHSRFLWQIVQVTMRSGLLRGLDRIKRKARVLHITTSFGSEAQVRVEGSVPPCQEARLNLSVLRQTSLANLFRRQGELLQRSGQGILAGGVLGDQLRSRQRRTSNGMAEGLGLRLGGRRRRQGRLGLGGGGGMREQLDFFANGATEVIEGFANIRRIVVGFVGVLGTARLSACSQLTEG